MKYQLTEIARDAHRLFVQRVVETGEVWGLKSDEGWVSFKSNQDEDRDVWPFWSDAAYARRCRPNNLTDYQPTLIPLDKFLALWLPGMDKDGHFAGTNWDQNLCGMEVYPLALKEQIETAQASGGP